jgi:Ice-binding-like
VLRSVASMSVLGGTGVANTGLTTVSGDLGVPVVDTVTGFPPGIVSGTTHNGDAAAAQAQAELAQAYDDTDGRTPDSDFSGDLNGRTFTAGVHHTSAALALTGTLTLDAENDPGAVFIFQVDAP